MRETRPGAVSLIWPPQPPYTVWWQFWRRHLDLLEFGNWLMLDKPNIDVLCRRLVSYVSPDLYWVTAQGSEPIVNSALSEGLHAYGTTYRRLQGGRCLLPDVKITHGSFMDVTLTHVAARLSRVRISSSCAIWTPAAGAPLRPWLERQERAPSIRMVASDNGDVLRVKDALAAFVLNDFERAILADFDPNGPGGH